MKPILRSLTMMLLIVVLLGTNAPQVSAQTIPSDINQMVTDLSLLEPYVHYVKVKGVQTQVLDTEAASAAGFSNDVILLASEMVAYQNDLVVAISKKSHLPKEEKYPKVKQFFDLATSKLKSSQNVTSDSVDTNAAAVAAATIPPCGNWTYPVPNYTPGRTNYSSSKPETTLISWGFHHTLSYACGYGNCSTADFTRGRSYTGPYGTCSSPRFRDQGRITGTTTFNIQYGEPNPEITTYGWPYWNWGAYVQWWHNTY